MANIILDATKSTGVSSTVTLNPGDQVKLEGFELSQAQQVFVNESGQLVIVLQNGTQFLLTNFAQMLADNPENALIVTNNGDEVSYSDVIAKYTTNVEQDVEPALGPDTAAASTGSSPLSEGSDAAQNSDLYGAGFGLGDVVTSDVETEEVETVEETPETPDTDVSPIAPIPPNAADTIVSGVEDTTFALNIPAPSDVDSIAALLEITITSMPSASEGVIQLTGVPITVGQVLSPTELTSLTFVPATNYNGTVTLNFNVTDELNQTTASSHSITVTAVADSPEFAAPSTLNISEDSTAVDLNLEIPTDPDTPYGDVLSVALTTPLSGIDGTITLDGTVITDGQTFTTAELARLQFVPTENFNGTINIAYVVTDSTGNTATNTHTITVNAVNDAPIVTDSTSTQAEDSTVVDLNIAAPTDVEGDTLTVTFTSPLPADGTLYYADGITPVNVADNLTITQLTGLKFTPSADFNGDIAISYIVTDGLDTTVGSHTVTITAVNDAPVATDSTSTQVEDSTDIPLVITLPTDIDNTSLLASIGTLPTDGTLKFANGNTVAAGVKFDSAELATLTFTPNADFNGTVAINYTVEDTDGATDTATHTITVSAVNDAAVVTSPSTSNQDEDSTLVDLNITAPTDVDGDILSITLDSLPANGTLYDASDVAIVSTGPFTVAEFTGLKFTPDANFNGDVVINYTVNDGTVTTNGTHTITVNSVEDAPIVTNSTSTQDEDSTLVDLNISTPIDNDGDNLTVTIATLPTNGTIYYANGTTPVVAGASLTVVELTGLKFTPNTGYVGDVAINYTVTDDNTTVAGVHTVTMNNVEDSPVAFDSTSAQDEDSSLISLNIPAPTDPEGDPLTITLSALPTNGTLYDASDVEIVSTGPYTVDQLTSFKFTPNANFNGNVDITYTVADGTPSADTTVTHTIAVNSVNDAPIIADTATTSAQDEDIADVALGLTNPTDIDGDAMTFKVTAVNDGTLKLADGTVVVVDASYSSTELAGLTFTPNTDFNGIVNIAYEVSDGTDSTAATHTITVNAVNDVPIVTDSTSSQDEDTSMIDLGIPAPTDVDKDTLAIITSLPTEGTLYYFDGINNVEVTTTGPYTVDQLTSFKFTPNANFNGDVVLNYSVSDGNGGVTPAVHTITVNSVNDLPVVTNSTSTQAEDTTDVALNIPVATDVDGDAVRFVVSALPTDGTFTFVGGSVLQAGTSYAIAEIANLRFTPNADFFGTVTLSYTVADGVGADVAATHTIDVTNVNDIPVVTNSTSSQNEDTSATLAINTPTDADPTDTLTANIATLPTDGTLTFANGSVVQAGVDFNATELAGISFAPTANYNGTVIINYTVTDGNSAPVAGQHTITVNPVADVVNVISGDLVDANNGLDFTPIIRAGEVENCVPVGTMHLDAEYQYDSVLAGTSYNYDLPSSTFVSTDGTALTYTATYTYNGVTSAIPTSGGWVNIDSSTGDLSGSFPSSMSGLVTFNFTATSTEGASASKAMTYNVMSQAQFNAIDLITPVYGNFLLPEETSDNIMIGFNNGGVIRYDLLNMSHGITADLDKGYVDKQNGSTDLIDGYKHIDLTGSSDTVRYGGTEAISVNAGGGHDTLIVTNSNANLSNFVGFEEIIYV